MSQIVITGATGLLGARALTLLCQRHVCHAIVRTAPRHRLDGVTYYEKDLAKAWSVSDLPPEIDAVLHLAQARAFREFPQHAMDTFLVNTGATAVLLDYAVRARANQFILASTGGLYGSSAVPINEEAPVAPPRRQLGHYFATKQSAELLTGAYLNQFNVTVLRPFFIYGPGQGHDMLVPRLVDCVRSGRPISLVGATGSQLNPVFVDDVVHLLDACLHAQTSQVINVAGPDVLTVREISELIGRVVFRAPVFERQNGEPDTFVADISRMKSVWSGPLTTFPCGLEATIQQLDLAPC